MHDVCMSQYRHICVSLYQWTGMVLALIRVACVKQGPVDDAPDLGRALKKSDLRAVGFQDFDVRGPGVPSDLAGARVLVCGSRCKTKSMTLLH